MSPRAASRGFTLVELLVTVAVVSLVVVYVLGTLLGLHRSYTREAHAREATEAARGALSYLEGTVRLAGYGLDPRFAFDLGGAALPGGLKDNFQSSDPVFTTDDLAFRYRDPGYLRRGQLDSAGGALFLEPGSTFGAALSAGQALLLACPGAVESLAVRLTAPVGPGATAATLLPYGPPFPTTLPPCLVGGTGAGAAFVMLLREVRVRVVTLGGRPYLVAYPTLASVALDQGYELVAADVENFQVAYVMNRPTAASRCCAGLGPVDAAGNGNWVLGDAPSEALPASTPLAPLYATAYDHVTRFSAHPANIRAVRLSVVVRSRSRDASGQRMHTPPMAVENSVPASTAPDGFFRLLLSTAVPVPNLRSRAFFLPPIRHSAADAAELNAWGG